MISGIDENSVYNSLKSALIPSATLIDGRSEEDMLCFLANFASVINFYNQDNRVQGNWAPFILKDPVFLTAMISRTKNKDLYTLFLNNSQTLKKCLQDETEGISEDINFSAFLFNRLFGQIDQVYRYFRQWVFYMERSHAQYEFKRYVTTNIRDHYSQFFWALISLKEAMHNTRIVPGITAPVDLSGEIYNHTEQIIWETGMGKAPYWEILDMGHQLTFNTPSSAVLDVLQRTGGIIFDFLEKCVSYAAKEYSYLKQKKSSYPDTLLLRGFVDLLKQHQGQLNGISKKHLDFYYRDILRQQPLSGSPDSAYVVTTLAKPGVTFTLPASTLFNAGTDSQKKPVVFTNPEPVALNPGVLTELTTLSVSPFTTGGNGIYMNTVPAPGTVQKDQQGNIVGFDTFGNTNNQGILVATGISFASPMFLLKEGDRTITLTMTCDKEIDSSIFNGAAFYFSTVSDWLPVKPAPLPVPVENVVILCFTLDATQPPIEPFKKNPDSLETQWPLFKIQFQQVPDPAHPPLLKSLQIDVSVNGVKNLQLYNDYGSLSTKAAFPFMGPAPMKDANFIVGSSEIFSKPVKSFSLKIDWNSLPTDFETYYLQYNQYLNGDMNIPPPAKPCWLNKLKKFITGAARDEQKQAEQPKLFFYNDCFTVAFKVLQDQLWADLNLRNTDECTTNSPDDKVKAQQADTTMFSTPKSVLEACSTYQYISKDDAIIPDANLQNSPLKYTGQNTSGFLKMTLTGPVYGFGSLLYPAIVFQVTLDNAQQIADSVPPSFTTLTPKPFVPKVSSLSATYGATAIMTFATPDSTYPLQCFLYTPFQNYQVFDAGSGIAKYNYTFNGGKNTADTGIPMFAPLSSSGYLFMGIDKLFTPGSLNLYFELARIYALADTSSVVSYSYLSTAGWKNLEVLADSTRNFSCSGIIKIDVPSDVDYNGLQGKPGKCWLAISVSAPPQYYAQTIFCTTNGFITRRTEQRQGVSVTPLAAGAISKTLSAVPQLASIQQPFPSFGGTVKETGEQMNLRVSNRIKTKGRASSADDFFRLIIQSFPDIFYTKTVFNHKTNINEVYVVKAYVGLEVPGAFTPLISACAEEKIHELLVARSSCFVSIGVSNFTFQFIKVTLDLVVDQGNTTNEIVARVGQQLNVFLSPWILSGSLQVTIDTAITAVQIASFVVGLSGVLQVNDVRLQTWTNPATDSSEAPFTTEVKPFMPSMLLVSCLDHNINCKAS